MLLQWGVGYCPIIGLHSCCLYLYFERLLGVGDFGGFLFVAFFVAIFLLALAIAMAVVIFDKNI